MRRPIVNGVLLFALLSIPILHPVAPREPAGFSPQLSPASDLIDAVNNLRISQGIPVFQTNDLLSSVAQAQAEYMASISMSNVETDAQGRHPIDQALAAGYPAVRVEANVGGGSGWTTGQILDYWMSRPADKATLLDYGLKDIGVGIAVVGTTNYYCLLAGLSTGGTPVPYHSPTPLFSPTPTLVLSTPNADGSIIHVIQKGDTPGTIAEAYGISLDQLFRLNGITADTMIYPGNKLLIRPANTATPTQPTPTASAFPTATPWPTSTPTSTETPIPPTPEPSSGMAARQAGETVIGIAAFALLLGGIGAWISARKRK